jgi:hypothetical protein
MGRNPCQAQGLSDDFETRPALAPFGAAFSSGPRAPITSGTGASSYRRGTRFEGHAVPNAPMSSGFSQYQVLNALTTALVRNVGSRAMFVRNVDVADLVEAIIADHPGIPVDVLRVYAVKLIRMYTELVSVDDVATAGLHGQQALDVLEFLTDAYNKQADDILRRVKRTPRH